MTKGFTHIMTTTTTTQFDRDIQEIKELAVQEANGGKPTPEHFGTAFSKWLFGE
tara:strand:+ start:879 stop:1040 length:162 start_codon:yes stop_codon:yes gene_type:complete